MTRITNHIVPDFFLVFIGQFQNLWMGWHSSSVDKTVSKVGKKEGEVKPWAHAQTIQGNVELRTVIYFQTEFTVSQSRTTRRAEWQNTFLSLTVSNASRYWCYCDHVLSLGCHVEFPLVIKVKFAGIQDK